MRRPLLLLLPVLIALSSLAQNGWHVCNTPAGVSRIDDIFMVNTFTGYAVAGDGRIMKTTDGGENWSLLLQNSSVYCRSVEFINEQKGFVGSFYNGIGGSIANILVRTNDGGVSWTDLTPQLPAKARKGGICGLAIADNNTIYAGGNWYQDSGYIIKSTDGGATWNLIDMSAYATSIIDLLFISKDTGFATGKNRLPFEQATILYTTNGGASWTIVYQAIKSNQYCWKIQRLTDRIFLASIEDGMLNEPPRILRSLDGGMNWGAIIVSPVISRIQGVGFIDPLRGWAGGGPGKSFETKNGGKTWDSIPVCPFMNRVFRVNDTTILASGHQIWKYKGTGLHPVIPAGSSASLNCAPNPVQNVLTINVAIEHPTRVSVIMYDGTGSRIKVIDNTDRPKGSYQFYMDTRHLSKGIYYVVLSTHEDRLTEKIVVGQ